MAESGYTEIQLLGQNVNSYQDPSDNKSFAELLMAIGEIAGIRRVRFTTSHPRDFGRDIVEAIDSVPTLCDHVHLPVQSGSSRVLASMSREYTREQYLERIALIKAAKNRQISITTDVIVGFPGETEEDFAYLLDWLEEARIDRAGAFKYEAVAGAPANDLGLPPVPDEVKESRWKRFMERQQAISARLLKQKIGQRIQVIVDEPGGGTSGGAAKGRGKADAPGVDGAVHISSRRPLRAGDIVSVKVEGANAYDLRGTAT